MISPYFVQMPNAIGAPLDAAQRLSSMPGKQRSANATSSSAFGQLQNVQFARGNLALGGMHGQLGRDLGRNAFASGMHRAE